MAKFNPDIRPDMLEPEDPPQVAEIGDTIRLSDGTFGRVVALDPDRYDRATVEPIGELITKQMRDLAQTALMNLRTSIAALSDVLEESGLSADQVRSVMGDPGQDLAECVQNLEVLARATLPTE